ncbi:Streptomyces sporulation and cell division protein, SsgA [Geodermatophilus saharensis]|uniref:Streptomyces sporulation and cell division protein, SsgA n=1 Tax=Geodermatophilus saharensis TaxID=1137994 RepID=A0A239G1X6_9ACTN|nr:SsgA family sporulation/cell division regulator [Geodermatophilus saharensis]SNS62552.1 Streptomyces sporulation and cell division protein, SsgA [Geodermatophilus saharensis]
MSHRATPGYSVPTTLHLVGPGSWTEVPAVLSYEVSDPFAVRIGFGEPGDPADDGITWLLGRELLTAGLEHPAGDGDVRLWPARTSGDVLYLHLRAPSGEALFELSRATVAAFLQQTEALVPTGQETAALDVDEELAVLLGGGDPGAH